MAKLAWFCGGLALVAGLVQAQQRNITIDDSSQYIIYRPADAWTHVNPWVTVGHHPLII
jgi:hypothetical protein